MSNGISDDQRAVETSELISFEISPRSQGGVSLFDVSNVTPQTVEDYFSEPEVISEATRRLVSQGVQIDRIGKTTISARATAETIQRLFGVELQARDVNIFARLDDVVETVAAFSVAGDEDGQLLAAPSDLQDVIEGAVLPVPHEFMQSPLPPPVAYHHLDVPGDVNLFLNADKAHHLGRTGKGVKVAMVDTGFYRHPYYVSRGYQVDQAILSPDSLGSDPLQDTHGHGTAELANACAVAPGARFMPVKTTLANPTAAFATAVDLRPDVITNSWGRSLPTPPFNSIPAAELPLAAAIADAVNRGIVVCFSAGNGQIGWPAMHDDVIAVGGAFGRPDGTLEASSYASSFTTPLVPGRSVPDVCGLVGMLPRGIYIMLPLQPQSAIDQGLAGGAFPNRDETAADDGWACISGTSASSPQAAGAVAVLLECCPRLTPHEAKSILQATAQDVTVGSTNPTANQPPGQHQAVPGPDLATGPGCIDVTAAVVATMARCESTCRCHWRKC